MNTATRPAAANAAPGGWLLALTPCYLPHRSVTVGLSAAVRNGSLCLKKENKTGNHRITEYAGLEETQKNHAVQLLDLHRTAQKSDLLSENIVQRLLELCKAW